MEKHPLSGKFPGISKPGIPMKESEGGGKTRPPQISHPPSPASRLAIEGSRFSVFGEARCSSRLPPVVPKSRLLQAAWLPHLSASRRKPAPACSLLLLLSRRAAAAAAQMSRRVDLAERVRDFLSCERFPRSPPRKRRTRRAGRRRGGVGDRPAKPASQPTVGRFHPEGVGRKRRGLGRCLQRREGRPVANLAPSPPRRWWLFPLLRASDRLLLRARPAFL